MTSKLGLVRALASTAAVALASTACLNVSADSGSSDQQTSLGKPGDPVDLVIGYQPYYSQAWSGAVMREKKFWESHLPEGSSVTFEVGLQGSVIVSQMLAGKQQIGYAGDMPSLVGTSKSGENQIRIVAGVGTSADQCNVFLVPPDAPDFASPKEAVRWMDGKTVATPQGSCTDRFTQAVFKEHGVEPSAYLNQSIEVISSNFQSDRIDAATVWEPVASHLVNKGLAKRVASGADFGETDAGFLIMSEQLIAKRPDIVKAYLAAERDAQRWMADPDNAMELARIAADQTEGYSDKDMWDAMYRDWPVRGGEIAKVSNRMPFVVDQALRQHIETSWSFLHGLKVVPQAQPPQGIVRDEFARDVLGEDGADFPVSVRNQPASRFTG